MDIIVAYVHFVHSVDKFPHMIYFALMKKAKLMGILNVTPDSFFAASRCTIDTAMAKGEQMIVEGVDILDVGGESTRPGSLPVDEKEELARVLPIIQGLKNKIPVSIDTKKAKVAEAALKAGAAYINDVSGFEDPAMQKLAAETGVPIFVMHMQGTPADMQHSPSYPKGIIHELSEWFDRRIALLLKAGIQHSQIHLDPGIGFGKSVAHNLEIMHNLPKLKAKGYPLLIGVSRKSFLSKILNKKTEDLLPATIAMNTLALINGADMLRVHDTAEHRAVIDLMAAAFNESLKK